MLNGAPAGNPTHSQGAVPCFQDPLQPGIYFPGQGGHMATGAHSSSLAFYIFFYVFEFFFPFCTFFTKAPPLFCLSKAESVVLDGDLEVQLEIRPVSDSGLLLLAGKSPEQHLSVVLSHGEVRKHLISERKRGSPVTEQRVCVRPQVTVSLNSGSGDFFSTSFTPEEPLCNGRWHTITGESCSTPVDVSPPLP